MKRLLIPLGIFVVLLGFLLAALRRDPRQVPSPFIGKPAPAFELPRLDAPEHSFRPSELRGQVWLLNVWASWCVACREEHPTLLELARAQAVSLVGLNYKDRPDEARRWLDRFGDPYRLSVIDIDGRVGIDYGVYGVPETFLIDRAGVVRYRLTGPVSPALFDGKIMPLLRELQR